MFVTYQKLQGKLFIFRQIIHFQGMTVSHGKTLQ